MSGIEELLMVFVLFAMFAIAVAVIVLVCLACSGCEWIYWRYLTVTAWIELKCRGCWILGRRTNPFPVRCEECGWIGRQRKQVHGYQDDGSGEDVEPVSECPKCESEI